MSTSTQRILDCKRSITAPVNNKDVLKIDGTLINSSTTFKREFAPPAARAARAARAAWAAQRPPAAGRLLKPEIIPVIALFLILCAFRAQQMCRIQAGIQACQPGAAGNEQQQQDEQACTRHKRSYTQNISINEL